MRHVTTNIRLPEDLWKSLKIEAAKRGKRLSEVVRERLALVMPARKEKREKIKSPYGLWKGINIPDSAIEEAKKSLFPDPEKFLR